MAHETASIHIDKKQYHSPNPTTGAALYVLGNVAAGYELLREVPGPGDDIPIPNDATPIQLENGWHFFSAKKELNPGNGGL